MKEFSILGEVTRCVNKTSTLDFQRANFSLFGTLIWKVPWEAALKNKGSQEGWAYIKKETLKVQEQPVPM